MLKYLSDESYISERKLVLNEIQYLELDVQVFKLSPVEGN